MQNTYIFVIDIKLVFVIWVSDVIIQWQGARRGSKQQ